MVVAVDAGLFAGYDVRGIYGKGLDAADGKAIGAAFASALLKPGDVLVVGGDARTHTPPLKKAFIEGAVSAGVDVVDIGLVPTHVVTFEVLRRKAAGGAVITASHNPGEYNGVKMYVGDVPLSRKQMDAVAKTALSGKFRVGKGKSSASPAGEYYSDAVAAVCKPSRKLKVVIDSGNGACGPEAKRVFEKLGHDFEILYLEPDGTFPNHLADPHKDATLVALKARVIERKADLGIALDGDGDRVAFIDEKGVKVRTDDALVVLVRHYLSQSKGASVVYDCRMSNSVADEVKRLGGVPILSAAGRTLVGEACRASHAVIGAEQTGHTFCGDFHYHDDAIFVAAKFAAVLSQSKLALSKIIASVPKYPASPEYRLAVPNERKRAVVAEVAAYAKAKAPGLGAKVNEIDGIRLDLPNGAWGLVRVSNTEPAITCRFEAKTKAELDAVYALFRARLVELGVDAPKSV